MKRFYVTVSLMLPSIFVAFPLSCTFDYDRPCQSQDDCPLSQDQVCYRGRCLPSWWKRELDTKRVPDATLVKAEDLPEQHAPEQLPERFKDKQPGAKCKTKNWCRFGDTRRCKPQALQRVCKLEGGDYCQGQCKFGKQRCVEENGCLVWNKACEGAIFPSKEVCDGKDNDCDGKTDDVPDRNCFSVVAGGESSGFQDGPFSLFRSAGKIVRAGVGSSSFYITDRFSVREISIYNSPTGVSVSVSTIVGKDRKGFSGGKEEQALFGNIADVAVDTNNTLYIADQGNFRIRKFDGVHVSTFAGSGQSSLTDGSADKASFQGLQALVTRKDGSLLVLDGNVLRSVDKEGQVKTLSSRVDRGLKLGKLESVYFSCPEDLELLQDSLYVAESCEHKILRVNLKTMIVSTFLSGNGKVHRDGKFENALVMSPRVLTSDYLGRLYISGASLNGGVIQRVDFTKKLVKSVVGQGSLRATKKHGEARYLSGTAKGLAFSEKSLVMSSGNRILRIQFSETTDWE